MSNPGQKLVTAYSKLQILFATFFIIFVFAFKIKFEQEKFCCEPLFTFRPGSGYPFLYSKLIHKKGTTSWTYSAAF